MKTNTLLVFAAASLGLILIGHSASVSSATYDETTYLRVASAWWRTGNQAEISRMGSPVTFWKLQLAPVYFVLDHVGKSAWVDDPIANQADLLPIARVGSLWIWLAAFGITSAWARHRHGDGAAALAAWIFALSPNLVAHGGLLTMEMPLIAASAGVFFCFDLFLETRRNAWFVASAMLCGLAFSLKFTAVLYPPLLGLAWLLVERPIRVRRLALGMAGFGALMVVANLVVTGFDRIPLSEGVGSHPFLEAKFGRFVAQMAEAAWPADWVGFLNQIKHQRSGGPSYLLGEVRTSGWWYYYPVALAVKVPLAVWLLVGARLSRRSGRDLFTAVVVLGFLAVSMLMSKRNYGIRYLLPTAPVLIVWLSDLANAAGFRRQAMKAGLVGLAVAVAWIHPHELSFFNRAAGGIEGGRRILADSNLDWGQGLRGLALMQRGNPNLSDLTLYYFGDTEPSRYQVAGTSRLVTANDERNELPPAPTARTRYLAVSTSLVWGPWGRPGRFETLRSFPPVASTPDGTILIYETAAVANARATVPSEIARR